LALFGRNIVRGHGGDRSGANWGRSGDGAHAIELWAASELFAQAIHKGYP
jgi:hypothetical protein